MKVPGPVRQWLQEGGCGEVQEVQPVAGGCINQGTRLKTTSGSTFFLKQNRSTPKDMFLCEFNALSALAVEGSPRVPEPFLAGETFLLLEDLNPGPKVSGYWETFGRQLARMHMHVEQAFGFIEDNYIGSTPQPNPWTQDGYDFFARHRLGFQAQMAEGRGLLEAADRRRVDSLASRLPDLVPEQPPSLLHGDLWSGNAITGPEGEPAIIDPATHYGWAEAELGMTQLFGGFPGSFYQAYEGERPLEPGWQNRLDLYNLYHLLNHLNLFGQSYLGRVQSILRRYTN